MSTAKIFWSGRSQAVRLPKEFRFDGTEVTIRRQGNSVILEPVQDEWAWLDELGKNGPPDEDFIKAIEEEVPQQERPELDDFFK